MLFILQVYEYVEKVQDLQLHRIGGFYPVQAGIVPTKERKQQHLAGKWYFIS
jgi:hypothetical protein